MFFWKMSAQKEIVVDEAYIEELRRKRKFGKIIQVATEEFKKGNQAGFLYAAFADALEHTSKNVDYKKMINLYTQALKSNPRNIALYRQRARFELLSGQVGAADKDLNLCLQLKPNDPDTMLELGNIRLALKKYIDAEELYSNVLRINPNVSDAYLNRAKARQQLKKYEEAISDISYAITMLPESQDLLVQRADMNFVAERYADAIKDYSTAININPRNFDIYDKRAKVYVEQNNYNYAIADYEQILQIDKKNVNAMVESAKILHKYLKNSNAALSMIEMAIKTKPSSAEIYTVRAYIRADINDLDGSMADFNTAIKYSKDDNQMVAEIYSMRGELYYKQGYYEEAIKDYNIMIEKKQNDPELYKKRAIALRETGNYSAAARDYSYIIRLKPDELDNYITLAYIYSEQMKNNTLGLKVIDRAIEKFGKSSIEIYQLKGEIFLKTGKYAEAVENFKVALEINPSSIDALYFKGNSEYKLGHLDKAIADYTKIIEIDNEYYKAYNKRAFCYVQKKDFQTAISDYSKAIELNPDLSSAIVNRAKCKEVIKDYKGALADYSTAITLNPKNLDVYYLRGNLKQLLGDSAGALDDFSRTLKK